MEPHEFLLLVMRAVGGEIQGKTKLQKTVYFLGILTDRVDTLGYRAHFYGPYSSEVAEAVMSLKAIGVLDQNIVGGGTVDDAGFEVKRYDYRLNHQGQTLAAAKAEQYPHVWKQLEAASQTFRRAGEIDYMPLSVAAKTYFMLGQKRGRATETELAALAPRFGWHVTPEEIRDAAQYLQKLGLVEMAAH